MSLFQRDFSHFPVDNQGQRITKKQVAELATFEDAYRKIKKTIFDSRKKLDDDRKAGYKEGLEVGKKDGVVEGKKEALIAFGVSQRKEHEYLSSSKTKIINIIKHTVKDIVDMTSREDILNRLVENKIKQLQPTKFFQFEVHPVYYPCLSLMLMEWDLEGISKVEKSDSCSEGEVIISNDKGVLRLSIDEELEGILCSLSKLSAEKK